MNKPRLNPQLIAIFFVITAIFIGSGLFFFSLTKDMLRNSVEAETKAVSERISSAIDTTFSKNSIMSGSYGALTMLDIFKNDEAAGKDMDIWLISDEGRIYVKNGQPQTGNLFTDASLEELGGILSDEKYHKEGYSGWTGDSELILLNKNCCIIKPVLDGSMYTVTLNYCREIKAIQRRQFALFMLVILIVLSVTIVTITNIIFNYRRQIIRLATIDELTGLMNRKSFHNEYSLYYRGCTFLCIYRFPKGHPLLYGRLGSRRCPVRPVWMRPSGTPWRNLCLSCHDTPFAICSRPSDRVCCNSSAAGFAEETID